jgi:CBS domain-containing protein
MPTVQDILRTKGADIVMVAPGTLVLDAARLMDSRGTGSVLVVEGGALRGIFTERDVLRRVVAAQRDPATTPVSDVMTVALITCQAATTLDQCAATMSERRIRHLPVLEGDRIVGVVTSGDMLAHRLADQADTIQHLNSFIYDVR